jgi:uncharacterized Zn finger protein (UPF0148 family)
MDCESCGKALPKSADFCPSCGTKVGTVVKSMAVVEEVGEKTYELAKKAGREAKPLAKRAAKVTGEALQKVGTETQKIGTKLKDKGDE